MTISDLPPSPSRKDSPDDFVTKADRLLAALPTFVGEVNELASSISAIASGAAIGIPYTFSTTTTDSDPGTGKLRLDNATQSSATTIRADLLGSDGATWTSVLDTFDDSTSTVKGQIRLYKPSDTTAWIIFNVMSLASPSGYKNITVQYVGSSSSSPFLNNDPISLAFTRNGDLGTTTSGTETIFIPAASFIPNTTAGCSTLATTETTTNKRMYKSLGFDPASAESAQFFMRMPKRWNAGTITASLLWLGSPITSGASSSYSNTYGNGNRTASIVVTAPANSWRYNSGGGAVNATNTNLLELVDNSSADHLYPDNSDWGHTGDYLRFQFPTARVIDEITITHESFAFVWPSCAWQGSNDGATWTTLGSPVLGLTESLGTSIVIPVTAGGPFTYYQLIRLENTTTVSTHYVREITFKIATALTDTTAQAVKWNVSAVAVSDADSPDVATGTAQSVTDAVGTSGTLRITSATSAITLAGSPAAQDGIWVTVTRDAADGADTMTSDAKLLGVEINYTASALNDN